jgi:hypothetical protein
MGFGSLWILCVKNIYWRSCGCRVMLLGKSGRLMVIGYNRRKLVL